MVKNCDRFEKVAVVDQIDGVAMDEQIETVRGFVKEAKSILFITGAGISAESGLPTYRGIGGLYNSGSTEDGLPIEELLSGQFFKKNPGLSWKYLAEIAHAALGATYNQAHKIIAEIERSCDRVWTLTQNVDGFHIKAGSKNVIEIHGNMSRIYCAKCRCSEEIDESVAKRIPPCCRRCNSIMRPDVVLFGELLPQEAVGRLYEQMDLGFDLVFSIGTSSVFPYIAEPVFVAKSSGKPVVEINPDETEVSDLVDVKIRAKASEALSRIWPL